MTGQEALAKLLRLAVSKKTHALIGAVVVVVLADQGVVSWDAAPLLLGALASYAGAGIIDDYLGRRANESGNPPAIEDDGGVG